MEQEELINEKKTWLFEQIRSEYAAMAKRNRIFFWIICVFFGIFLIEVIEGILQLTGWVVPFSTKEVLYNLIFYVGVMLAGLYTMIATTKMAKTDTPEDLLVTYDKIKKIGVWTCVIVTALLVTSIIMKDGFNNNIFLSWVLLAWIFIVLLFAFNRNNQIKKLRDLVQKS